MGGRSSMESKTEDRGAVTEEAEIDYSLEHLVGKKTIPLTSPFWVRAMDHLDDSLGELESGADAMTLIHRSCSQLLKNRSTSSNLRYLIAVLTTHLENTRDAKNLNPVGSSGESLVNLLFIARVFLKSLIESLHGSDRTEALKFPRAPSDSKAPATCPPKPSPTHASPPSEGPGEVAIDLDTGDSTRVPGVGELAEAFMERERDSELSLRFFRSLVLLLVDLPVTSSSYDLHLETINTVIILASEQVYQSHDANADTKHGPSPTGTPKGWFLPLLLDAKVTPVREVTKRLLMNFISRGENAMNFISRGENAKDVALGPERSWRRSGIVASMKSAVTSLIMIPYWMFQYFFPPEPRSDRLSTRSALLLLILIYQDEKSSPYRSILSHISDDHDTKDEKSVAVPFGTLYDELTTALPNEWAILLFYSLLHHNKEFKQSIYAKSDVDVLVSPLLEMLYEETDLQANKVYMGLVILVILTADPAFCDTIHTRLTIQRVPWFKDQKLTDISLGSLTMIILFRVIQLNLSEGRDLYLHTNCLGVLSNMAPHCRGIHVYASKKLMELLDILSRRFARMTRNTASSSQGIDLKQTTSSTTLATSASDLETFSEFVRLTLEITCSCLGPRSIDRNVHLLYWLLLQKDILTPFASQKRFKSLVEPLHNIIEEFDRVLPESSEDSVENNIPLIEAHARIWKGGVAVTPAEFIYEEQTGSEEFFVPYVWNMIFSLDVIPYLVTKENEDGDLGLVGKGEEVTAFGLEDQTELDV